MRTFTVIILVGLGGCAGVPRGADTTRAESLRVDSGVVSAPARVDSAPRRAPSDSAPLTGSIQLRTDRSSYAAGDPMTLTLVNGTTDSYAYNPCTRLLERESGGGWSRIEETRICTMIAHILKPRETRVETTELTSGLEAGRYRVIILLTVEGTGTASRSVRAISEPIAVTR